MPDPRLTDSEIHELTWGWWVAGLIGLLSLVAGIIVIAKPSDSLKTLAVITGIFILVDGIAELIAAALGGSQNRGLLAVIGVLSVIAGVLLIRHPLGGVKAVALVLAIWLIAAGMVRCVAAFAVPDHRFWRIVAGVVLIVFGIVIVSEPHIGYATLALITGIGFICYGLAMLVTAAAMFAVRRNVHATPPSPA